MKKLIIIILMSLTACSNLDSARPEIVSLLDYTTQQELNEVGLTADKINEINALYSDKKWGLGYSRYEGYQRHTINNFDFLVNPNNPDEFYVVKEGNYLVGTKQPNVVILYEKNTKFPNPMNTAVYYDFQQPLVVISKDKQSYFDADLDGVDVVYEQILFEGNEKYMNYVDLLPLPNYSDIIEANIPDQQCEKLVGPFACCLKENQTYQPYHFDSESGWESFDSETAKDRCNEED